MNEKTIKVSDLFIHLYKMFNVTDISNQMKQLSKSELMLLIILSVDSYQPDDLAVLKNLTDFKSELKIIHTLQTLDPKNEPSLENTDPVLLELGNQTGEKYVNVNKLRDKDGNPLPEATSQEEAIRLRRDISITNIIG